MNFTQKFIEFLTALHSAGVDPGKIMFISQGDESTHSVKAFRGCNYYTQFSGIPGMAFVAVGSTTSSNLMVADSSFEFGTGDLLRSSEDFLSHLNATAASFDANFKGATTVVFGVSIGYLFVAGPTDETGHVAFCADEKYIRTHYRPAKKLTPEQNELRIQNCLVFAKWLKDRYPDASFCVKDRGFKGAPKIQHEWMMSYCPKGHAFDVGGGQFLHFSDGKRGKKFGVSTNDFLDVDFVDYKDALVAGFDEIGVDPANCTFIFTGKIRELFFSHPSFQIMLTLFLMMSNGASMVGAHVVRELLNGVLGTDK